MHDIKKTLPIASFQAFPVNEIGIVYVYMVTAIVLLYWHDSNVEHLCYLLLVLLSFSSLLPVLSMFF